MRTREKRIQHSKACLMRSLSTIWQYVFFVWPSEWMIVDMWEAAYTRIFSLLRGTRANILYIVIIRLPHFGCGRGMPLNASTIFRTWRNLNRSKRWRNSMFDVPKYSNQKLYYLMDNNIFIWCFIEFGESQTALTLALEKWLSRFSNHVVNHTHTHTFLAIYPIFHYLSWAPLLFLPLASFQIDL